MKTGAAPFTWVHCEGRAPWHVVACAILIFWRATRDRSGMRGVRNNESGRSEAEVGAVPTLWAGCRVAVGVTNAAAAGDRRIRMSTLKMSVFQSGKWGGSRDMATDGRSKHSASRSTRWQGSRSGEKSRPQESREALRFLSQILRQRGTMPRQFKVADRGGRCTTFTCQNFMSMSGGLF